MHPEVCRFPTHGRRIDDPAKPPAVLIVDGRGLRASGRYRLCGDLLGILDDESVRLVVPPIALALTRLIGSSPRSPERRVIHRQLRDDVVTLAHMVHKPGPKRGLRRTRPSRRRGRPTTQAGCSSSDLLVTNREGRSRCRRYETRGRPWRRSLSG